jgi:uncharacterized protein (UPF0335 family)
MLTKTNAALLSYAERIKRLQDQIEGFKSDVKAVCEEAKADGYTPKALKQAIKIHSMDQDKRAKFDAEQTDLLLYLEQLEGREIQ